MATQNKLIASINKKPPRKVVDNFYRFYLSQLPNLALPAGLPGAGWWIRTNKRLIRWSEIPPIIVAGMLGNSLAIVMTSYDHFILRTEDEAAQLIEDITSPIPIDLKDLG